MPVLLNACLVKEGRFTLEYFENNISSYELGVMTRTCNNIFVEVFGPCAHCCLCEALEQEGMCPIYR